MSDRARQIELLDELRGSVESLLLSGMTAASSTTQEKLAVAYQEASRMRLLRLGSTLRIATEEMKRFDSGAESFSPARLSFFLGRAWLLSTSMASALRREDEAAFARLCLTPKVTPAKVVEAVVLGVFKRHVPGAFSAFELRLRTLTAVGDLPAGSALVWPFVFPANADVPPEAFLALEQRQKFRPADLLEHKRVTVTKCAIAEGPPKRLALGPDSTVTCGKRFEAWGPFATWDREGALARLSEHEPDPLTLPIELQEEAVIDGWTLGAFASTDKGYDVAEVEGGGLRFELRVASDEDMKEKLTTAARLPAEERPRLCGLVHYELCRLVLQPLALLTERGPTYLCISETTIDKAALVRALNLT